MEITHNKSFFVCSEKSFEVYMSDFGTRAYFTEVLNYRHKLNFKLLKWQIQFKHQKLLIFFNTIG